MDHLLCFLLICFSHLSLQSLVEAKPRGFTIDLIHRHSQLSPFYNNTATPDDFAIDDALRSIARATHFRPSTIDENKIESPVIPNVGSYLMKLSIGSPAVTNLAIADTGSDLVWIQCEPCDNNCYPQDRSPFNPMQSSTYMELSCDSKPCQYLPIHGCGSTNNKCEYTYRYGDRSFTMGDLATDTFTFDSTDGQVASFPNSIFGCGHNNAGTFNSRGSGLVGLGGGPLSLISQLGAQIEQKFSYCLLPRTINSASKLRFGTDSILSGPGVVSTPIQFDDKGTFYYLTLEGASVGNKRIPYSNQMGTVNQGNIVIDSGTTLTILESRFYSDLEAALKEAIGLNPIPDPRGTYNLCYDSGSVPEMTVVFHFTGADVMLKTLNLFRNLSYGTCLAMLPDDELNIYGNWAQMNFQVEYDLGRKQVSFAPADCTQH
ncbi:eukaryotic aspartyl protease family protein [Actinidia rufa]|uniref:Eukaryotic aspartyl protease family protein n=1 Tax=Actinidia rufa TaxID=165716 RepID=A0A7J0GXI7_9ERIC|nr:eukaryotic aspartyl protease family protein [Actinidia rufa]